MSLDNNLEDLYFAFDDSLSSDGKNQKMVVCSVCKLEGPSYSARSKVCEMCFDTDFWGYQEKIKEDNCYYMWAIKIVSSKLQGNIYLREGSYWAGNDCNSSQSLSHAKLFLTKNEAESVVDGFNNSAIFSVVQIGLQEV